MRLEKFFNGDVLNFFTVNNVSAKPSDAEKTLVENKITAHMDNIMKNAVPVFYGTKKKTDMLQRQINQRIANLPEYDIVIHATEPRTDEHIRMYYLDWISNGTRSINLGSKKTENQPNFFMTAMMNGCSLHFKGDRKAPLISHINAMGIKTPDVEKALLSRDEEIESDYALRGEHMTQESRRIVQQDNFTYVKPKLGYGLQPADYRDNYGEKRREAAERYKSMIEQKRFYRQKWNTNKRIEFIETRIQCFGIRDVTVGWTFYMCRKLIGTVKYRDHFYSRKWNDFFYFHILPPVEIFPSQEYTNIYKCL